MNRGATTADTVSWHRRRCCLATTRSWFVIADAPSHDQPMSRAKIARIQTLGLEVHFGKQQDVVDHVTWAEPQLA